MIISYHDCEVKMSIDLSYVSFKTLTFADLIVKKNLINVLSQLILY